MKQSPLKSKVRIPGSNKLAIVIIAVALLALYAASIADFFARAPSAEMSREVAVTEVGWIHTGVIRPHVVTIPASDGAGASIVVVDDGTTRILDIDVVGDVVSDISMDLDLTRARELSGYAPSVGRIVLFSRVNALTKIEIDKSTGTYSESVVEPDAESFRSVGPYIVIEKDDGLYGYNSTGSVGPRRIAAGPVMFYEMDASPQGVAVITAKSVPGNRFDLTLLRTTLAFDVEQELLLLDDSANDTYRKPLAVQLEAERATMLFVRKDDRYNSNELTAWRVHPNTGRTISEYSTSVPILNSRYQFFPGDDQTVSFLMRSWTVYGYNLVKCSLSAEGATFAEYTKTRALSIQSGVYKADGFTGLVFSDIGDNGRTVYYASDHPDLMKSTTRWSGEVLGRATLVTLTNSVMALFIGAIYAFLVSLIPYLAVEGLRKVLKTGPRLNFIVGGIGAVVYTALKLAITYFIIYHTANYRFTAPWIGEVPRIFIVLVITSAISYVLVARMFRMTGKWENPITGPFLQFLLIDSVQYTLLFILYTVTTILLHKI